MRKVLKISLIIIGIIILLLAAAVGCMPQGVIDHDYALRFVESCDEFSGFPIILFGHSWGAYSVGSILKYRPDVKALVMAAGFTLSIIWS